MSKTPSLEFKLSDATDQEILRRRAEQLARGSRQEEQDHADEVLVQVLGIGDERYGVELTHIWEVFPYREITPVPGTPAMVRGVINFRGEIVPIYDLIAVVSGSPSGRTPTGACVVLGRDKVDLAVAVDAVEPPLKVNLKSIRESISRPGDHGYSFVRGFTDTGVVVLNAGAILDEESLIVDLEV